MALMPVDDVLRMYAPAYGGTWEEMFAVLAAHPDDQAVVTQLVAELRRDGTFREPIVLDTIHNIVRNGTHRLAAAHQHGLAVIDTVDHEPATAAYSQLELRGWIDPDDDIDLAFETILTSGIRSFPLPDGTWSEMVLAGATDREMEIAYTCPRRHLAALIAHIHTVTEAAGHRLTITDWRLGPTPALLTWDGTGEAPLEGTWQPVPMVTLRRPTHAPAIEDRTH